MRFRLVLAVVSAIGLAWWSPVVSAQSGPNCTRGCPCGNACIDCSDTCRVGGGTARGGETEGNTPERVAINVAVVIALTVGLVAIPLGIAIFVNLPKEPPEEDPSHGRSKRLGNNSINPMAPGQTNQDQSGEWLRQTQTNMSELAHIQ